MAVIHLGESADKVMDEVRLGGEQGGQTGGELGEGGVDERVEAIVLHHLLVASLLHQLDGRLE